MRCVFVIQPSSNIVFISDAISLPASPLTSPALPAPPTYDSDHAKCGGIGLTQVSVKSKEVRMIRSNYVREGSRMKRMKDGQNIEST